jgi:HECT-domain (ubiquitin-transferase)
MLDEQLDLSDLADVDAALHRGLMAYLAHPLASLGMDDMTFTTEVHYFGRTQVAELKPGGHDIAVRRCTARRFDLPTLLALTCILCGAQAACLLLCLQARQHAWNF